MFCFPTLPSRPSDAGPEDQNRRTEDDLAEAAAEKGGDPEEKESPA